MTFFRAWAWFKKWGGWVFGGLASLVAMLIFWRREQAVKPSIREVEDAVEEEAERKKREEAAKGERQENVVHEEASGKREAIITELEGNAEGKDDPDKVAEFLKDVGDEMRH